MRHRIEQFISEKAVEKGIDIRLKRYRKQDVGEYQWEFNKAFLLTSVTEINIVISDDEIRFPTHPVPITDDLTKVIQDVEIQFQAMEYVTVDMHIGGESWTVSAPRGVLELGTLLGKNSGASPKGSNVPRNPNVRYLDYAAGATGTGAGGSI